jgi:hypothetical protein
VIPIGISKDWNLIVRAITPIIWQPLPNAPSTPETGVYGLGDMQSMDRAVWRRSGKNHDARVPAGVADCAVFWECGASRGNSRVDHAVADSISVPQVNGRTEKDDVGEKIKTDGSGTGATKELRWN